MTTEASNVAESKNRRPARMLERRAESSMPMLRGGLLRRCGLQRGSPERLVVTKREAPTTCTTTYSGRRWDYWPLFSLWNSALMITSIRWRIELSRKQQPDTRPASRLATISFLQAVLVVLMVLVATGMARGYGMPYT